MRWLKYAFFILCFLYVTKTFSNVPHKRFEYKFSFKPPYLAQKDGSVPFWEYGGSKYFSVMLVMTRQWTQTCFQIVFQLFSYLSPSFYINLLGNILPIDDYMSAPFSRNEIKSYNTIHSKDLINNSY